MKTQHRILITVRIMSLVASSDAHYIAICSEVPIFLKGVHYYICKEDMESTLPLLVQTTCSKHSGITQRPNCKHRFQIFKQTVQIYTIANVLLSIFCPNCSKHTMRTMLLYFLKPKSFSTLPNALPVPSFRHATFKKLRTVVNLFPNCHWLYSKHTKKAFIEVLLMNFKLFDLLLGSQALNFCHVSNDHFALLPFLSDWRFFRRLHIFSFVQTFFARSSVTILAIVDEQKITFTASHGLFTSASASWGHNKICCFKSFTYTSVHFFITNCYVQTNLNSFRVEKLFVFFPISYLSHIGSSNDSASLLYSYTSPNSA